MSIPTPLVLALLGEVSHELDHDASLAALADRARRSPFEVHRAIRRVAGETAKQYAARVRLDRAASELVTSARSILEIALAHGFASHEVFTRAFVRRFGITPRAYRKRGLAGAAEHAKIVEGAGPCIGLHHLVAERNQTMPVTITKQEVAPRLTLVMRRKIAAGDLAKTLGEVLPAVWSFAQQRGVAFTGQPFTRYLTVGLGRVSIEAGLPIASAAAGEGEIAASELPGGPVAVATHVGPYERLAETHAEVQRWLDEQGLQAGAPWEVYVTDPATTPDPAAWRTEIFYPLRGA